MILLFFFFFGFRNEVAFLIMNNFLVFLEDFFGPRINTSKCQTIGLIAMRRSSRVGAKMMGLPFGSNP